MRFTFALTVLALVGCQAPRALSTTEQEAVTVYSPATDFGSLQVGQTSAPLVTTVRPAPGANYDVVNAVSGCNDFLVNAPGLPAAVYRTCEIVGPCLTGTGNREEECPIVDPGDNVACPTGDYLEYSFSTSFRPSVAGPQSCPITIYLADGTQRTVSLSGVGTPPPIDIDVSPGSIAFGDVRRNTTSNAATVTARNLGGATLTITGVTVSGPFAYSGSPTTVPPGGLVQYGVTCQPTTVGGLGGTFTIQSNDPATPTINVALSCNGVDSNLDISPSPTAIATRVGEPVEQTITIGNSGAVATTLDSVALAGTGITMISGPTMPLPLGPGATTQVLVRFDATAAGEASGTLTVMYEGGMARTSQITARAATATMSLDPDGEVDFGPICSGETRTRAFTVLGTTDGGFQITQITEPGPPFVASLPAVPATVQPLGANQVKFELEVVPEIAGPIHNTLTLVTDIPGAAPREVQLMATALAPGIGATPEVVDLGSNELDTTTFGQPVDITNCTDAPITITGARIEGVDAGDFAIVASPESSTVMPTLSGRYLVVFTARTTGQKHAELIVDHSAGTTIIPLDGEGLGPLDLLDDRGSYYACSAGGLAGWPIMLVLLALCFRRRR